MPSQACASRVLRACAATSVISAASSGISGAVTAISAQRRVRIQVGAHAELLKVEATQGNEQCTWW